MGPQHEVAGLPQRNRNLTQQISGPCRSEFAGRSVLPEIFGLPEPESAVRLGAFQIDLPRLAIGRITLSIWVLPVDWSQAQVRDRAQLLVRRAQPSHLRERASAEARCSCCPLPRFARHAAHSQPWKNLPTRPPCERTPGAAARIRARATICSG